MASVEDRVLKIVRDHMCWADEAEQSKVRPGAAFLDDLGADSLDIVELIMTAEEQFDIEIADAEAETIVTVSDAVKLIERKTAAPRADARC